MDRKVQEKKWQILEITAREGKGGGNRREKERDKQVAQWLQLRLRVRLWFGGAVHRGPGSCPGPDRSKYALKEQLPG